MTEYGGGGGKTMRVGVGTIGVVAAVIVAAIFFRGGGSGPGGSGTGTGTSTTQPMVPAQPQRPLRITIRENDYIVNERPLDLATVTELASKVPAGNGPAIMIERSPSSRAKAETDLKDALNKKQVTFTSD